LSKFELKNVKKNLKKKIINAISSRLISDQPIACLLSGGVDSSIISNVAVKILKKDIKCYSIFNKNPNYSEFKEIDLNIKQLKCDHEYLNLFKKFSINEFEKIIKNLGYPISAKNFLLYHRLNEKIKKDKRRVLINGFGSDEIFGGYYSHQIFYLDGLVNRSTFLSSFHKYKKYIQPNVKNKYLKNFSLYMQNRNKFNSSFLVHDIYENQSYLKKIYIKKILIKYILKNFLKIN